MALPHEVDLFETSPDAPPEYVPIAEIASGGMARVLLARRAGKAPGARLYALKVMHSHLADETQYVEMLQDEANLASKLYHPNVVHIVDAGTMADTPYLVMDYVEGCTLAHLIKKCDGAPGRDRVRGILRVALDLLSGLGAAHNLVDEDDQPRHLVHRDVSPGNVLVGVDGVARLTDFGVAKATARLTKTEPGVTKGKFAYMAPEQLLGKDVDHRADLFSFGVLLHNALTGESLFAGDSQVDTLRNVLYKEIPPPSAINPAVPAALDAVVLWALERDPHGRPTSAGQLRAALLQTAKDADLVATEDELRKWVWEVAGDSIRRRRRLLRAQSKKGAHMSTQEFRALGPDALAATRVPVLGRIEAALEPERIPAWVVAVASAALTLALFVAAVGLLEMGPSIAEAEPVQTVTALQP